MTIKSWVPSDIILLSGLPVVGVLGEAIDDGEFSFLDSDNKWYKVNPTDATKPDSTNPPGICLAGGAIGQRGVFCTAPNSIIQYGSGVFSQGEPIVADNTPGGLANLADLTSGTSEEQSLDLSGATGGNISLSFEGQATPNILYNEPASVVQAALEALSTIGAGNVICSGGPLNTSPVSIAFQGSLSNTAVEQIAVTNVDLTGTPSLSMSTTTPGVNGDFLIIVGYAYSDTSLLFDPTRLGQRV